MNPINVINKTKSKILNSFTFRGLFSRILRNVIYHRLFRLGVDIIYFTFFIDFDGVGYLYNIRDSSHWNSIHQRGTMQYLRMEQLDGITLKTLFVQ